MHYLYSLNLKFLLDELIKDLVRPIFLIKILSSDLFKLLKATHDLEVSVFF